ncbi:MAG: S9 family peptidase [Clostridium sp.]|nr:S9 family peptidase [Clostridium sp.]
MKETLGKIAMIAALGLAAAMAAFGQGKLEDYNRAYQSARAFSPRNVYYSDVNPTWLSGAPEFWYERNTPEGKTYAIVNAETLKRRDLFDNAKLASALEKATGKECDAKFLNISRLNVSGKGDTIWFVHEGRNWEYLPKKNKLADKGEVDRRPRPKQPHWMVVNEEKDAPAMPSPDGTKEAFIKDSNVYVRDLATGKETKLSIDGTDGNYYSSWIYWSPDSKKVASCKIRPAQKRYVHYVESSPADQLQPKLHTQEYAKPGDELRFKVPCIFNVETGEAAIPKTDLFANQYDITNIEWMDDSSELMFDYNERGHKVYRVLAVNADNGDVRPIVEETSDKYVNYPRYYRHSLEDGKRLIWMSERDNWNHLYMYDKASGKPLHQITKGEWYVRGIQKVDEENGKIYFSANGVDTEDDPYNIRYFSINFDGSGMTDLTPTKGTHKATFSPDMKYLVDIASSPTKAPVATLRSAKDGKEAMELERADISKLVELGWSAPEVFAAPGRDGKTLMWGVIQRPSNFDPSKKYPVIEYIYQGPGDQYVPKAFAAYNHWLTPMAELGFIVVMVDGMSTSYRSREFENVCYKNLKDAGLPDHIAWIKAAAEKYPEMDIERLGIYGCSAGGQESTNALLLYPDFYKAAYSACGCHDNRMDKIWWNELWMGYPVDESYAACSNVENAKLLRRPLMLVVGELDDNVDPASTMQVANALIKANKPFELVVIPGARHTMGEAYGDHKRYDFFVKHLMGAEPPSWDEIRY